MCVRLAKRGRKRMSQNSETENKFVEDVGVVSPCSSYPKRRQKLPSQNDRFLSCDVLTFHQLLTRTQALRVYYPSGNSFELGRIKDAASKPNDHG